MGSSVFTMIVVAVSLVEAMSLAKLGEASVNMIRAAPDFVRRPSDKQNQEQNRKWNRPGMPGTPEGDCRPFPRPNTEWHPTGPPDHAHPSWTQPAQTNAPPVPQPSTPAGQCPEIWQTIIADLSKRFIGADRQCTDDARAAIRGAFHDCATWSEDQGYSGGCDGSLVNADEFADRIENTGLADWSVKVKGLKIAYPSVSVADLIAVSASVAIVSCPGGPRIKTYVGRNDSMTGSQRGALPSPFADGETNYQLFLKKGINETELAGLMGAHSVSKAFGTSKITVGAAQDTTPGIWDTTYYSEVFKPCPGMTPFTSDTNLAQHPKVGPEMAKMINNKARFDFMFTNAMEKMMRMGVHQENLVECTNWVPRGTNSREMRGNAINARIR